MPIVIVLVVLALVFGLGAVVKGLLWLALIAVVLVVVAGLLGRSALRGRSS